MIVGDLPQFTPVSIGWHDDVNDARGDIAQAIERVRGEEGVLLLTDMFGGTPSKLGTTFLETERGGERHGSEVRWSIRRDAPRGTWGALCAVLTLSVDG